MSAPPAGLALSQLITDFGRTNNLVAIVALRAKAADMNPLATAYQIKLAVDQAFYNALQTFAAAEGRRTDGAARGNWCRTRSRRCSRTNCAPKLDVSFANANLAQAKLLLLDAQNNYQAALSALSQVLGYPAQQQFELVDTEAELKPPPDAVSQLEDEAFSNRPEIAAQSYEYQAAQHFQKAERDLLFPTVRALGVVGRTPYGSTRRMASRHSPAGTGPSASTSTFRSSTASCILRARAKQACAHRPPISNCAI